jgi:hypothetical protein
MRNRVIGSLIFVALGAGFSGVATAGVCDDAVRERGLTTRAGFMDFMAPERLRPLKEALPRVADDDVQAIMNHADTMWYDEQSMVFLYQDSVETVTGGRANCVGREVGERNRGNVIGKLLTYFGPDYRFKFPFRKAAGTDDVTNAAVINFWHPPRDQAGRVLPVKWWKASARGRWHWVFPVGTVFGEVLYQKGPQDRWYVFEIRTRERYIDGWKVDLFRPFKTAESLARAIERRRPNWRQSSDLTRYVQHLRNVNSLVAHQMVSEAYGPVFPPVNGALDPLPALADTELLVDLLTTTPFVSTEGAIWKENANLETYAPSATSDFNIVPGGYKMGMIPVNEVSCNRCHSETGRYLKDLDFDIQLYGEVWGEDRLFTWHLFETNRQIFDTFDDADGSRKVNPRMVQAGLLLNQRPAAGDPLYKQLPGPARIPAND